MLILGVHGGDKFEDEDDPVGFALHDSAAVLIQDGEIVAGIEEERIDRIKHSNCFPVSAIRFCLESHGCKLQDVDIIATNRSALPVSLAARRRVIQDSSYSIAPEARAYLAFPYQRAFGIDVRDKIYFCGHHLAHAWSAFPLSGFSESLVLTNDGDGETGAGMVLSGHNQQLELLHEFSIAQSLGLLYENLIRILGYGRFDEYKVMGLAPYGNPDVYRSWFEQCYTLLPDGNYELKPLVNWFARFDRAGLLRMARRKGAPFLQEHKDFAASLQETVETITFHILRHYQAVTKLRNLCLAGGVAHNCTQNGKLARSGLFDRIFVQPASHDAGGALGAAIGAHRANAGRGPEAISHVYWGTDVGCNSSIRRAAERWSPFLYYRVESDIAATTAALIAGGAVVGWVQGRSEFGPRALGNRSILADPRPAHNKSRINEMVKKREQYRPFAPAVLAERIGNFFEVPPGQSSFPFMTFVLPVHEQSRSLLGATTHVDGTSRVQSVSRDENPLFWKLIGEFEKLTGVPVLLNTSFNSNAEPIVDSVSDAICCYLTTGLNYLVVGDLLITKRPDMEIREALAQLVPSLQPSRKLVKRTDSGHGSFTIESTKSNYFESARIQISPMMFSVLLRADGACSFEHLMATGEPTQDCRKSLLLELFDLWSKRALRLSPLER